MPTISQYIKSWQYGSTTVQDAASVKANNQSNGNGQISTYMVAESGRISMKLTTYTVSGKKQELSSC